MPFLPPNQQRQSTHKPVKPLDFQSQHLFWECPAAMKDCWRKVRVSTMQWLSIVLSRRCYWNWTTVLNRDQRHRTPAGHSDDCIPQQSVTQTCCITLSKYSCFCLQMCSKHLGFFMQLQKLGVPAMWCAITSKANNLRKEFSTDSHAQFQNWKKYTTQKMSFMKAGTVVIEWMQTSCVNHYC